MFNIQSFIKRPDIQIDDSNKVIENPNKYFININNEEEVKRYNQFLDFDYIDGAIIIKYNNHTLMDFTLWDLVDQLWSYFVELIENVIQTGYGVAYFPDQPVKIEMKVVGNNLLLFSLDEGRIISEILPMQEFISALLISAKNFFSMFMVYFGNEVDYSYDLNRINSIQEQLNF